MKVNYEKKLFIARVILALALFVGVLSVFQDWELVIDDQRGGDIARTYTTVVNAIYWGLFAEYEIRFHHAISYYLLSNNFILRNIGHGINLSLFLFLLTPIFLTRILSYSRLLWWLWLFSYISWHTLLIYIYQKHAPDVFVTSIGGGRLGYQPHISWLSGFYFGCSALVLHLLGMIFLLFSSPPTRKNT